MAVKAKIDELRELSVEELGDRAKDLDDQIFRLRIQQAMGQMEVPTRMRVLRRDRARVKTLIRERQGATPSRQM